MQAPPAPHSAADWNCLASCVPLFSWDRLEGAGNLDWIPFSSNFDTLGDVSALTPASASSISYPVVSTHSPAPATGQSINRGSEEWKIIGVAVISFSAVAAILLLAVFFDQWWGFIRDMVWKKRRKEDHVEELIPDWEKAGWEIRMARNNDRYPSLPPLARTKSTTRDWDDHNLHITPTRTASAS